MAGITELDGVERCNNVVASAPDGKLQPWELEIAASNGQLDADLAAGKYPAAAGGIAAPDATVRGAPVGSIELRNPLLARLQRESWQVAASAAEARPVPSLFEQGDVPAFCASGIDPQSLLALPWPIRHPVARATSRAEAYAIAEQYGSATDPDSIALAEADHRHDPGNLQYLARFNSWRVAGLSEDQRYSELFDALDETPEQHEARLDEQIGPAIEGRLEENLGPPTRTVFRNPDGTPINPGSAA